MSRDLRLECSNTQSRGTFTALNWQGWFAESGAVNRKVKLGIIVFLLYIYIYTHTLGVPKRLVIECFSAVASRGAETSAQPPDSGNTMQMVQGTRQIVV